MKSFFCFITLIIVGPVIAASPTPESVIQEVLKYNPSMPLTIEYVSTLDAKVQNLAQASQARFKSNELKECQNSISVNEVGHLTDSKMRESQAFESGFIQLEIVHCFAHIEPWQLINLLGREDFKRKAFPSLITDIEAKKRNNGILYNETTNTPIIGASNYEYFVVPIGTDQDLAQTEARLISNNKDLRNFPNPIFFRYTLTTAKKLGDLTALHVISFTRAGDLSGIPSVLIRNSIKSAQMKFINAISSSLETLAR